MNILKYFFLYIFFFVYRFGSETKSGKALVLITLKIAQDDSKSSLTINCEKMVIASMLAKELQEALSWFKLS